MNQENKSLNISGGAPGQTPNTAGQRQISVNAQYIKDFSFENPRAPSSFKDLHEQPKTDMAVDINAKRIENDLYEVELKINAKANASQGPVFIIELNYGALFTVADVPEEELETVLLVYGPSIIFPFARRIIADATRDGGFPPLMLEPIDFARLYFERRKAA